MYLRQLYSYLTILLTDVESSSSKLGLQEKVHSLGVLQNEPAANGSGGPFLTFADLARVVHDMVTMWSHYHNMLYLDFSRNTANTDCRSMCGHGSLTIWLCCTVAVVGILPIVYSQDQFKVPILTYKALYTAAPKLTSADALETQKREGVMQNV